MDAMTPNHQRVARYRVIELPIFAPVKFAIHFKMPRSAHFWSRRRAARCGRQVFGMTKTIGACASARRKQETGATSYYWNMPTARPSSAEWGVYL